MSGDPIAEGVLSLIPGEVFDGQVVNDGKVPTPPWSHVTVDFPEVAERGMGRAPHSRTVRVRVLTYGLTADSVRVTSNKVDAALEGARPTISGWRSSPVEQVNARGPVEDTDVTVTATNLHPMYGVLEYRFTLSPTVEV